MLKIMGLPNKSTFSKNNSNKLAFSKNNGNKLITKKNDGNSKIKLGDNGVKHIKKSEKLKGQKMFKSPNLAKSKKKSSKNRNSFNFDVIEAEPKFFISNAKMAFSHL